VAVGVCIPGRTDNTSNMYSIKSDNSITTKYYNSSDCNGNYSTVVIPAEDVGKCLTYGSAYLKYTIFKSFGTQIPPNSVLILVMILSLFLFVLF
jgi:hypothetical protein